MPSCIVKGCTHYTGMKASNPLLTMHVFPRELGRIKLWLQQIGQNFGDLDNFASKVFTESRTGKYRICSAHFAPGSYASQGSRIVLKADAVPTLFPGIHSRPPPDWNKRPETTGKSDNMETSTGKAPGQKPADNMDGSKRLQEGARRSQGAKQGRTPGSAQEQPLDVNGRLTGLSKDPKTKFDELSHSWSLQIPASTAEENRRALWSLENVMVALLQHLAEAPLTSRSQKQKTTRLLNQTAEIVSVLTGEEWTVVKKNSHISKFYNMIREVPIKVGDVAVFFSMDEWDYIEDHEGHYKHVMVEEPKSPQFNGSSDGTKSNCFLETQSERRPSGGDVDFGDHLDYVQTPALHTDDFIEPSAEPPQSERMGSSSGDKDDEDHLADPQSPPLSPPSRPQTVKQKEKTKDDDDKDDDEDGGDDEDSGDGDKEGDDDNDEEEDENAEDETTTKPAPPADNSTADRAPDPPKPAEPPSADAMDESSISELWIAQDGTTSSTWIPQDDPRPKGRNCFKYGKHAGRIQCPVSLSGTTILLPELPLKVAEYKHRCALCDLAFPDKYELDLHQMTHSKKQRL
ncbi:uncharacterized protein LOC142312512 isoform X2 [Anomaloglossus baeobatrachus]|uniref:uncharacterized protein LOC142312512 isoform X2 n=1 Tax=Anomaloglossus baeobatrachus TaxID=238106 RepID=UPI003F4FABE4